MTAPTALCPVQIGRDDEVSSVAGRCDRLVETGTGAMLLISGEAGVGKSRLAAGALAAAESRGLVRLTGHCAAEATTPYGPFATAIRRRIRVLDDAELVTLFAGSASLAAALFPEIAHAVAMPVTTPSPEDLFMAVWQLLRRISRPTGALLLLEDLHWADVDSLRMLSYLARELADLPVLIVGTYRHDELHRRHPLTTTLAELGRERRYDEIALTPLDRGETEQMLGAIFVGTEIDAELVDAFVERTDGNPFFVEELAKVLVERGEMVARGGRWTRTDVAMIDLPTTIRETLLARIRGLDETTIDVLELAAISGDRLDLPVLAAAAGVTTDRIDDVVREGLRLQLFGERMEAGGTAYVFRHALTREALADELVGPDRQRARRRLAQAVVTVHAADLDAVAAELADHYAEAGDTAAAIEYGLRAARLAARTFALDEASRRYELVTRLLGPHAPERRDVLLEAAAAVITGPDSRLGVAFATEARSLSQERGDPVGEARAILLLQNELWRQGDSAAALALCETGAEVIHGHDDFVEAAVLGRLIRLLNLTDRGQEADRRTPGALELAERSGNHSARSFLHGTRLLTAAAGAEQQAVFDAALSAAQTAGDLDAERNLMTNAGYTCLWTGDLAKSRELFHRAVELTERHAPHESYVSAGYAWLLALVGDYDTALDLALALRSPADMPTRIVALTALHEVMDRCGDPRTGKVVEELVTRAVAGAENQRIAPALAAQARQALEVDGIDAALPIFWEVLTSTTYLAVRSGSHWLFSPDCARGLAEAGRVEELAGWIDAIEERTGNDTSLHNLAAVRLCEGRLAFARGDTEQARAKYVEAVERYRAMPCPAREVEALLALAGLESRVDRQDASARAARDALAVAERIGSVGQVAAAQDAITRTESTPVLATVMVTDIVGSTARAYELGDLRWRDLLEHHHAIVRRELARLGGREIDTAGDGFLASFSSPAQAIRCAQAIITPLSQIGVTVRVGIHTGECQQAGEKLTGIAVHIASRVASSAGPGSVVVSSTVRDLVAGSGFRFTDAGQHEFKGVPGQWQLHAVAD